MAVPLAWDELALVAPDGITLRTIDERLGDDPWADQEPVDLAPEVETVERAVADAGIELEPFDRFRP